MVHLSTERKVRLLAGTMVLLSVTLTYFVSHWWLLLTTFIGVNQIQSSLTGFCPAEIVFKKMERKQKG